MREDLSVFPAKYVRLSLEPPVRGGAALERDATEQADGAWLVSCIVLPEPGIWTVRVIVHAQPGEEILLDAPILIEH